MDSQQTVVLCWDFTPFLAVKKANEGLWAEDSRGGEPLDFIHLVSFTVGKTNEAICFQCFGSSALGWCCS